MKKELIDELFQKFEAACYRIEDTDYFLCNDPRVPETQKIIDQAKQDGILTEQQLSTNDWQFVAMQMPHGELTSPLKRHVAPAMERELRRFAWKAASCGSRRFPTTRS